MALYLIERDFTDSTQEELGAATIRAKMCTPWYEGMEWIRSYYESALERTLCIYRANSEEDIRTHASVAGLPCGNVTLIDEILPADVDAPTEEQPAAELPELPV